ncbi:hypothetical protein [Methylomagnum ishizawai]|nr:hypothetical protein [Methylomagnum ishizawai]
MPIGLDLGLVAALCPGGDVADQVVPLADALGQVAGQGAQRL